MGEYSIVERDGHLTIITINRPNVLNALHAPAHDEFSAIFDDFVADSEQWVAIVTGAGDRAFSAGNDFSFCPHRADPNPRSSPIGIRPPCPPRTW